jgi:hydroxyacylglutathione hydrolase
MAALNVRTIVSEPFMENSYIVWQTGQTEAFVIDPGFDPQSILKVLKDHALTLTAIVCTHGHVDHIAGNAALKAAFPSAPVIIGHGDAAMLTDATKNLSGGYGMDILSPPADVLLTDGQTVSLAGMDWLVHEIPGHSPGHVVYYRGGEAPVVFGGDVLFRESIGRTDFPGGSHAQLLRGIRMKLWPLPAETIVYPGHGETTTIGEEMQHNPFLK